MGRHERDQLEAKSRPVGIRPNVEDVWKALDGIGVSLVEKKQQAAAMFGARYCVGARIVPNRGALAAADASSDAGAATLGYVDVCEYMSVDFAEMGRDYSDKLLKSAGRTVYANKQLTLTLREEEKSEATRAAIEKAKLAFQQL